MPPDRRDRVSPQKGRDVSRHGAEPAREGGPVPVAIWATASVAHPAQIISFAIGNDRRGRDRACDIMALRAGRTGKPANRRDRMAQPEAGT